MYYDADGNQLTRDEIAQAVAENRAVLRWSHGNWKNVATLIICETEEEAEIEVDIDTTGECYSMGDEVWSEYPANLNEALRAAKGALKTS